MAKKLKVYELQIDPENEYEVDAIALVEYPAIESDFMAFSKQQDHFQFSMDEEKQELIGAAMIPDIKITRVDKDGNEFLVYFSKDTIRKIAQNYFQKGYQWNTNIDHSQVPADSYVFQSFIVDTDKGIESPKGLNLPDGSWVVGVKVENQDTWKSIKKGEIKGFSVEGYFNQIEQKFNKQESKEELLLSVLKKINGVLEQKFNK